MPTNRGVAPDDFESKSSVSSTAGILHATGSKVSPAPGIDIQLPQPVFSCILEYVGEDEAKQEDEIFSNSNSSSLFLTEGIDRYLVHKVSSLLKLIKINDKENAEKIIKKNPNILLCRANLNLNAQAMLVNRTPLQVAVSLMLIGTKDDEEAMVEMILKYMRKRPNGYEKIASQLKEQFPPKWKEEQEKRYQNDSKNLKQFLRVVEQSKLGEKCEDEKGRFISCLKNTYNRTIMKGFVIDPPRLVIDIVKYLERNNISARRRTIIKNMRDVVLNICSYQSWAMVFSECCYHSYFDGTRIFHWNGIPESWAKRREAVDKLRAEYDVSETCCSCAIL